MDSKSNSGDVTVASNRSAAGFLTFGSKLQDVTLTEDNKAILMRWFDGAWNNPREGIMEEMFHSEIRGYGMIRPDGSEVDSVEEYKMFYDGIRNAFPDFRVEVHVVLAEGDMVAARCTCRGTHLGSGLSIPPTGRKVEIEGMGIVRIQDGKIIEAWNNFDFLGLYQQIGILAVPD